MGVEASPPVEPWPSLPLNAWQETCVITRR